MAHALRLEEEPSHGGPSENSHVGAGSDMRSGMGPAGEPAGNPAADARPNPTAGAASSPDSDAASSAGDGVAGDRSGAPSAGDPGAPATESSGDPSKVTATEETSRSGPEPSPSGEFGSVLVSDSVSLLDSVFDYFASRLRLEGYRLELGARAVMGRVLLQLGAGLLALVGLIFFSAGVANLISERLGSRASGLLIVGGFYLSAGVLALAIASARARSRSREPHR